MSTKTGVSRRCIDKLKLSIEATGEAYFEFARRGRQSKLNREQEDHVLDYLRFCPTSFHQETAWFIEDEFDIEVDENWVCDMLERRKFSRKTAERVALEQNDELREEFEIQQKSMPIHRVCCIDESASNERTGWRKYGYSPVGTPCKDKGGAKRSKRWSVLPAITYNGYLPQPLVYQGSITSEIVEDWVEDRVIPQLSRGMFLVMDNASIHRSARMRAICEEHGIVLVHLPPYSPNFNPIELSFSSLKAWVKRNIREAGAFATFGHFMEYAVEQLDTTTHAKAWFWSCGYR